jgi:hypothetical protein
MLTSYTSVLIVLVVTIGETLKPIGQASVWLPKT